MCINKLPALLFQLLSYSDLHILCSANVVGGIVGYFVLASYTCPGNALAGQT